MFYCIPILILIVLHNLKSNQDRPQCPKTKGPEIDIIWNKNFYCKEQK